MTKKQLAALIDQSFRKAGGKATVILSRQNYAAWIPLFDKSRYFDLLG